MDKQKLNSLRKMAGIPQDFTADPRPITEDRIPGVSQIFRGDAKDPKFYLVCDVNEDEPELGDVLTELDFPALVNILKNAENTKGWELFPHNKQNDALNLARKRLATAGVSETVGYGMEAGRPENTPHPTDEEMSKLEQEEYEEVNEFEPATNICPDCEGGEHPPALGECERCNGLGEVFEAKEKPDFADIDDDSDKKESAKKAAKEKKTEKEVGKVGRGQQIVDQEEEEVTESMHSHKENYPLTHKDAEHPQSVDAQYDTVWDKPEENEEDYRMANDTDSVKVPPRILSELQRVIKEVTAEAEKAKPRDYERAHYYEATAEAMQIVHDFLSEKTVEGLKQAQLYVHRMANVSRSLLPDSVWKFIVDGGQKRSLKSYMNAVKDPVLGKPFDTVDVKTLNKNTHTE
jgi:hypothetical protein